MTLPQVVVLAVGAIVLVLLVPGAATRPGPRPRRLRRPARLTRRSRRPLVLEIATQRLADHTGVRIDAAPEAAAAILGPETWELVRPDRERPADRRARGISPQRLHVVVESLERIGARG
jgi:hypothetical protein